MFAGENCTSVFKGIGKGGALKKLEKNPRFHSAFRQLGDAGNVEPEVVKQLEQFTCLMYKQNRECSVDVVRAKLLRTMVGEDKHLTSKSKIDLARLPPCYSALKPHIHRVNHRVALYKRAAEMILETSKPFDDGQGWMRTETGVLEPVWSYSPIQPVSLIDLDSICSEEEQKQEVEKADETNSDAFVERDEDF